MERRRLASRIVYATFLAVVVVFIVASAWQIVAPLFGWAPPAQLAAGGGDGPSATCVDGVARLAAALDRAFGAAAATTAGAGPDEAAAARRALAAYEAARLPEWEPATAAEVDRACAASPRGRDAFAALARLRMAHETFLRRRVAEIAPIRADVEAYLRR